MAKRALRIAATSLLGITALLVTLLLTAALGVQTPWGKRKIQGLVEAQLNSTFMGHFRVGLDRAYLSLGGLDGLVVSISESPERPPTIALEDVEAGWLLRPLLASLSDDSIRVEIPKLIARRGFVDLSVPEKLGALFAPRNPEPAVAPDGGPPAVLLDMSDVELNDVTLRVSGPEGPLDVHIAQLLAQVWVGADTLVGVEAREASAALPQGFAQADVTGGLVIDERGEMSAVASVLGNLDDSRLTVAASLLGEDFRVVGIADAPATAIAEMDLGWAPTADAVVEFQAVSTSGEVEAAVFTLVGGSALDARAQVNIEPLAFRGAIGGRQLNPADYAEAAERGLLTLEGQLQGNAQTGLLQLAVEEGVYAGEALPRVQLTAQHFDSKVVTLDAFIDDGSQTTVEGQLTLGNSPTAQLRVHSGESVQLRRDSIPAIDWGAIDLDASAKFDSDFGLKEAALQVNATSFGLPGQALALRGIRGQVQVDRSPRGQWGGSGRVTAASVRVAGQQARNVGLGLRESEGGLLVDLNADILHRERWVPLTAKTHVRQERGIELSRVRVTATVPVPKQEGSNSGAAAAGKKEARAERLVLTAESVNIQDDGEIRVGDAKLTGVGELRVNGTFGKRHRLLLSIRELDLQRLIALVQQPSPVAGLLSGEVDVELQPASDVVQGRVQLNVDSLRFAEKTLDTATIELQGEGRAISGALVATMDGVEATVNLKDVDVRSLNRLVSKGEDARLSEFVGELAVAVCASHSGLKRLLPDADVPRGATLDAELKLGNTPSAPMTLTSDIAVGVDAPGQRDKTGRATVHLMSDYQEGRGSWQHTMHLTALDAGAAHAKVDIDLALAEIPLGQFADRLRSAQIVADVELTYSDLALLPRDLPLPGLEGRVSGLITWRGTIERPSVDGTLDVRRFRVQSIEKSLPVDVELKGNFRDNRVAAEVVVAHEEMRVATAEGKFDLDQGSGIASARLEDFSIGCFPYLRDYGVEGHLTGFTSLEMGASDGDREPRVSVYLLGRGFKVYGETIPFWSLVGTLQNDSASGRLQVSQTHGSLDTQWEAHASSDGWQKLDAVRVSTALDNFEIRPLLAAVRGPIGDLSGKLNGNMKVNLVDKSVDATGNVRLTQGRLLVPVLGREIRDIQLDLIARPGKIDIEGVEARFGSGRFEGGGGLAYGDDGNLELTVDLNVPSSDSIPILSEGREIAEVAGRVTLKGRGDENGAWNSTIDLNRLRIDINEEGGTEVGAIDGPDYLEVGFRGDHGVFQTYEAPPEEPVGMGPQPEPMRFRVNLGRDVWVYRGRSTFAALEGSLDLELGRQVVVEGKLQIPEGRIDVMGRVFEVEPSTVTFTGDTPPDPEVVAEAAWQSPSGHVISASFRGPVTSGTMQLKSEPPLSYGEILNVLLFDDPTGAGDSEGSTSASSVAGTLAGAGLGRTLSDLTDLNIQTSVQTTESGASRPEVGVRLSPRFAFQVSYNPQPVISLSEPPDQATVSLDWRISKRWSLDTSLGDQGSVSADLAWEFRY